MTVIMQNIMMWLWSSLTTIC